MTESNPKVSRPLPAAARPSEVTADRVTRLHRLMWLPFWFAAFLSAMTLASSLFGAQAAVDVAFVSFLPMAFWFGCATQRALSERLWRIEQQLGAGGR